VEIQPLLDHLFEGRPTRVSRITTGKFNESYFVGDGRGEYVLRIAPAEHTPVLFYEQRMMRREPGIHHLVKENTSAPVARILEHDFSGSLIPNDWLLMERLPGGALSETPVGDGAADALFHRLGMVLRQVHAVTSEGHGYPEGGETGPLVPRWYDAFRTMWSRLLDDIVSTGLYSPEERDRLVALLEHHSRCFRHDPQPSLLHMDIWSQNLLTDTRGELHGIVDWDRGLWGDPEIEFSVLEYCGTSPDAFWSGYGSVPERDESFEVRRTFYLLYEHQKYIYIRSQRDGSPGLARRYAEQSLALASRLE